MPPKKLSPPTPGGTDYPRKRPLRTVFVVAHDSLGGAARAAYRVFDALRTWCPDRIEVIMRTPNKTRADDAILGGKPSRSAREFFSYFVRTRWRKYFPRRKFVSPNTLLHSEAKFSTGLGREINRLGADVVLLGWLGNSTLSIEEIGKLKPPVVWRLSDMWMFSGAEHYTDSGRYRRDYSRSSRPTLEAGPDIDRETFQRKLRNWRKPSHVVALTEWLAEEAKTSTLTKKWPFHVIPVPIDTDQWKPLNKQEARLNLGLNPSAYLLLFGSGGGTSRPFKGAELLFDSLAFLHQLADKSRLDPIELALFGQSGESEVRSGFPVTYLGRLDDSALRSAYAAADVLVMPSTLEAFGQVAAEAQACGTPVVAFDNSGLSNVVVDGITGKLARALDPKSLAEAILWTIQSPARSKKLREASRREAVRRWHPSVVANQYADVLEIAASENRIPRRASS